MIIPFGLSVIIFSQGCNKDEEPTNPPTISLSGSDLVEDVYTTDESGEISLTIAVNAPNGFNVLRISYDGIDVDTQEFPRTEDGQTSLNLTYELTDIVYGSSGSFTITFQAVDDSNLTTEQVITVQPALPTIELAEDNQQVEDGTLNAQVGSPFNLRYRFTFPSGFGQFKSTLSFGENSSESVVTELPPTQGLAVTDEIIFTFDETYLDLEISYTLVITDALGNSAELVVPVNLTIPPAKIYSAILLAAPTGDKTSKTFFSTNIGETYSVEEVNSATTNISKEIDFGYYYGATNKASLAGPGNYPMIIYDLGPNGSNWSTLNITNFKRTSLTNAQFIEFTVDSQLAINDAYDNASGSAVQVITQLVEGEIIAFKTDMKNNKNPKGLFKVVSITGTDGSDGKIELEIIVNQ